MPDFVSGRFLSDLFQTLEANGIPATKLLGDLPISVTPTGETQGVVEWSAFVEFMKRLENEVGGPAGLEACATNIGQMKPAPILRGLAGFSASPQLLFRAAVRWALRRAMPGIEAWISQTGHNELHFHIRIHESLRACPQVFHFGVGASRGLPRILGLADAVVDADIGEREAHYRITLPPSPNLIGRLRRFCRTLFSAGSVLESFENQQLELHAQHDALRRSHAELEDSEQRYRALTDAAIDVLCELDLEGRIVYVSASTQELLGYTPEQITGSHYRLWIPKRFHARAAERFEALVVRPPGGALTRELVTLHAASGRKIVAEASMRSYINAGGEWRLATVFRDVTDLIGSRPGVADRTLARVEPNDGTTRVEGLRDALASRHHTATAQAHTATVESALARSLEMLIAALDARRQDAASESTAALVHAAESMTRIVHELDTESAQKGSALEKIELHKLVEAVRLEFAGRSGPASNRLHCRVETQSAEIRGRGGLLSVGLLSLLDLAAGRIADGESIVLSAGEGMNSAGEDAIEFRIELEPSGAAAEPSAERAGNAGVISASHDDAEAEAEDEFWALSEAIASDVAQAHGGEVAVGTNAAGRPCSWLRIPRFE